MKKIVEGECGRSNALVGLASQYGTSNQRVQSSIPQASSSLLPSSSRGEAFANEFLADRAQQTAAPRTFNMNALVSQLPTASSSSSLAQQWGSEFAQRPGQSMGASWASQFQASRPSSMEAAWAQIVPSGAPISSQHSGMWSTEFLNSVDTSLNDTQAPIFSDAFADAEVDQMSRLATMNEVWKYAENEQKLQELRTKFTNEAISSEYIHEQANPFMDAERPAEVGQELLRQGDLGGAILAYEAATQQNPGDSQAWCNLGLALAENEQDTKAITAFRKCLAIDNRSQQALLGVSVSLANESLTNDALEALDKWIITHTGGDPGLAPSTASLYSSFLDMSKFKLVEDKFLEAARRQQGTTDAELQNALGVLYNLSNNYDRAIECLRLAVAYKPHDPRLWNRLGATLANGDKTSEAIGAYREAINRYPAYVRARFNLGISCMHLASHKEAVEHFLTALELQKGNKNESSIWNTMRSAILRLPLETGDAILRAADTRDISQVCDRRRARVLQLRSALQRVSG